MEKIKVSINGENRVVIIPMEYDAENDNLNINTVQMEPIPDPDDDISKDPVLIMTEIFLRSIKTE